MEFVRQRYQGLWDIRKAVEYGCKASARTIESIGAQDSIPWADEVDRKPVEKALSENAPTPENNATPERRASPEKMPI